MDGKDLKLRRVAADVRQKDVALAMGVPAQRVSVIENSRVLTPELLARYLTALAMCIKKSTSADEVA